MRSLIAGWVPTIHCIYNFVYLVSFCKFIIHNERIGKISCLYCAQWVKEHRIAYFHRERDTAPHELMTVLSSLHPVHIDHFVNACGAFGILVVPHASRESGESQTNAGVLFENAGGRRVYRT